VIIWNFLTIRIILKIPAMSSQKATAEFAENTEKKNKIVPMDSISLPSQIRRGDYRARFKRLSEFWGQVFTKI